MYIHIHIPQGTVLANNLPTYVHNQIKLYADDVLTQYVADRIAL